MLEQSNSWPEAGFNNTGENALSKEYFTYYIILSILLGSKILVRATLAARTPVSV